MEFSVSLVSLHLLGVLVLSVGVGSFLYSKLSSSQSTSITRVNLVGLMIFIGAAIIEESNATEKFATRLTIVPILFVLSCVSSRLVRHVALSFIGGMAGSWVLFECFRIGVIVITPFLSEEEHSSPFQNGWRSGFKWMAQGLYMVLLFVLLSMLVVTVWETYFGSLAQSSRRGTRGKRGTRREIDEIRKGDGYRDGEEDESDGFESHRSEHEPAWLPFSVFFDRLMAAFLLVWCVFSVIRCLATLDMWMVELRGGKGLIEDGYLLGIVRKWVAFVEPGFVHATTSLCTSDLMCVYHAAYYGLGMCIGFIFGIPSALVGAYSLVSGLRSPAFIRKHRLLPFHCGVLVGVHRLLGLFSDPCDEASASLSQSCLRYQTNAARNQLSRYAIDLILLFPLTVLVWRICQQWAWKREAKEKVE